MKVVKITWIDSCSSDSSWTMAEDVNTGIIQIETYGIVIKETDEFISVAQNYGNEPEQFCNIMTIPKGCIKETVTIPNIVKERSDSDEDVGIRKELIAFLKNASEGNLDISTPYKTFGKWLAWLEKQGEQKYSDSYCRENCKGYQETGKCFADGDCDAKREADNKQWSEEDKKFMYDTLSNLTELKDRYGEGYGNVGRCIDWLKSLKDRVQPKQEWSEEDEAHINGIMDYLLDYKLLANEEDMNVANGVQEEINWLKSLRPQTKKEWDKADKEYRDAAIYYLRSYCNPYKVKPILEWLEELEPKSHWKPSDEQMEALLWCVVHLGGVDKQNLGELYEDLKKLML